MRLFGKDKKKKKKRKETSMFMHQCKCEFVLLVLNMVIRDAIYSVLPSFWKVGFMVLGTVYHLGVKRQVLADGLVFFCLLSKYWGI